MVTISFMHEILIISFMAEIVMITLQQKIMITRDGGMMGGWGDEDPPLP